jgi:hypothetical protein
MVGDDPFYWLAAIAADGSRNRKGDAVKLIDKLTREQLQQLAAAARKKRPGEPEFRMLARRQRELKLASKPSGDAAG